MTQEANPVVPVNTADDLARLIVDWFTDCHQQLAHAGSVPDNVNIKAFIHGKERSLTPSERQAFMAGVGVVAAIFEKLPFEFVPVQEEGEQPDA